jgi:hypothetical protein
MISTLRTIAEIAFGVIFLVGAIFSVSYILRHGEEFYGSFADKAWFPPSRTFVRRAVIPRAFLFTVLPVLLQVGVATLVLARGDFVKIGLIVGAGWLDSAERLRRPLIPSRCTGKTNR